MLVVPLGELTEIGSLAALDTGVLAPLILRLLVRLPLRGLLDWPRVTDAADARLAPSPAMFMIFFAVF